MTDKPLLHQGDSEIYGMKVLVSDAIEKDTLHIVGPCATCDGTGDIPYGGVVGRCPKCGGHGYEAATAKFGRAV